MINAQITKIHQEALDRIGDILIELQDDTLAVGEVPRRFDTWGDDDGAVLWWDVSMTGGEIVEPPSHVGSPDGSDWPFEHDDEKHLIWVPLPKLARNKP